MKKEKNQIIICICLALLSIVYTLLVKYVDVQAIGPNGSLVGFASINKIIFNLTGVNMLLYHITEWLGIIPIFMVFIYAFIGLIQAIKRKSILMVDKKIIVLGVFYIVVLGIYVLFEKVAINYRPVLINNVLEASYPSSHTLLSICVCGSSIMINNMLYKNIKIFKIENVVSIILILLIVIGRLVSGVHWFSDIIGSIIISIALLKILKTAFNKC